MTTGIVHSCHQTSLSSKNIYKAVALGAMFLPYDDRGKCILFLAAHQK